jgi:mono/diheme cytochrome c family protein
MRHTVGIFAACVVVLVIAACTKAPAESGAELFAANCASCHGRYGEGDGPAAADAARQIPDLRYLAARNGGEYPRASVAEVIDGRKIVAAHGDRLMPVWGDAFAGMEGADGSVRSDAAAKIQALVDYLGELQQRQ